MRLRFDFQLGFAAGTGPDGAFCDKSIRSPLPAMLAYAGSNRGRESDAYHIRWTIDGSGPSMSLRSKLQFVGLSDTGKVREHNEDTIGFDADIGLLVLADGMGGYNAGEVASGIAVKTIVNLVREAFAREELTGSDKETGLSRPGVILRDAIFRANKIIHQTSKTQPQCEGMGTTIVSCIFYDNKVITAHVGDSRLYRLRNDKFQQMTMDHSLLQELVDRGFYSPQEAQRATN